MIYGYHCLNATYGYRRLNAICCHCLNMTYDHCRLGTTCNCHRLNTMFIYRHHEAAFICIRGKYIISKIKSKVINMLQN